MAADSTERIPVREKERTNGNIGAGLEKGYQRTQNSGKHRFRGIGFRILDSARHTQRGFVKALLAVSLNQIGEVFEKIPGIVWTGGGFRVILHAEDRRFLVAKTLHGLVI